MQFMLDMRAIPTLVGVGAGIAASAGMVSAGASMLDYATKK